MKFIEFIIFYMFEALENLFSMFTIVYGKAMLEVLYSTCILTAISIISKLLGLPVFINPISGLIAVAITYGLYVLSKEQNKDLELFKASIKGNSRESWL